MFKNQYDFLSPVRPLGLFAAGLVIRQVSEMRPLKHHEKRYWLHGTDPAIAKLNFQSPAAIWGFLGRNPGKCKTGRMYNKWDDDVKGKYKGRTTRGYCGTQKEVLMCPK